MAEQKRGQGLKSMELINKEGKKVGDYITVNERIRYFRENYDGAIVTELLSDENGRCLFKASVFIDGELKATGYAYEQEGAGFINKTSYIENCETSAVGRALGMFGIGIDTSVASYDEVANAIEQQEADAPLGKEQIGFIKGELDALGVDYDAFCKWAGVLKVEDMKMSRWPAAAKMLEKKRAAVEKDKAGASGFAEIDTVDTEALFKK